MVVPAKAVALASPRLYAVGTTPPLPPWGGFKIKEKDLKKCLRGQGGGGGGILAYLDPRILGGQKRAPGGQNGCFVKMCILRGGEGCP